MRFFLNQTPAFLTCRAALAFSWIYQGAVPKIVCQSSGETALLGHLIPVYQIACLAVFWIGAAEILFGLLLLVAVWQWVFWLNMTALIGLLLFVALFEPAMFVLPFNPLTLNFSLIALSVIALIELKKFKTSSE
ncbi:MAG: DoxX-like family protein [Chlorobium sp.]|nr:DoxX-like family protein [Chlorobium sp.]